MPGFEELERRIGAALDRIEAAVAAAPDGGSAALAGDLAVLREEVQAERDANAQLQERLRSLRAQEDRAQEDRAREEHGGADLAAQVERLTAQLDAQGLDLRRMRKNVVQLRETVRALREAQEAGVAEPHLINRAMLAELDALRAERASETAELDEILAELKPLTAEVLDA